MMSSLFKKIMKQEDKGVAALEFALLAPVLLIMLAGLFDVTYLVYCHNKMERTAQDVNNIVTRGDMTKAQLQDMLTAAKYTAQPFNFEDFGKVIVTSVAHPDADIDKPPQIMWRESSNGDTGGSRIDVDAPLPGGLTVSPNDTVIFTEVFFSFDPLFNLTLKTDIYAVAAGVPRQGTMTTLPPG